MLLIDGYNVLFARGEPRDVNAARDELVAQIESFCARTGQRARVYFDPPSPTHRRGTHLAGSGGQAAALRHVKVVWPECSADEAICAAIARTGDRTAYRVVTSDREVADAAHRRRLAVTPSADFLREIEPPSTEVLPRAKRDGVSEAEARAWLRTFGMEGDKR